MVNITRSSTPKRGLRIYPLGDDLLAAEPQPGWQDHNHIVQVNRSDSVRDLRNSLLDSVYQLKLSNDPNTQVFCVIAESKLTKRRVWGELEQFKSVIDPELVPRVHIAFVSEDLRSPVSDRSDNLSRWLMHFVDHQLPKDAPKGIAPRTVFAHLVRSWLDGQEAIPVKSIQEATLLSYPTVAKVLEDLDAKRILMRTSDRRVGLIDFPWEEWRRWSTSGTSKQETLHYVDPTGLPVVVGRLASRLNPTAYPQLALSGVIGAKHYFPELDIRGQTRLDLVATGSADSFDHEVIRELDPALELADAKAKEAAVVVHFPEQRSHTLFRVDGDKQWADPLDCLADLYEMHLDAQADEMVRFLIQKRATELKTLSAAVTGSPWRLGRGQ